MEYLDPEEEFELQYADELEALKEFESIQDAEPDVPCMSNVLPKVPVQGTEASHPKYFEEEKENGMFITDKDAGTCSSKRKFSIAVDNDIEEAQILPPLSKKLKYSEAPGKEMNSSGKIQATSVKKHSFCLKSVMPICVTKFDGTRLYYKMLQEMDEEFSFNKNKSALLPTSIDKLKLQVFAQSKKSDSTISQTRFLNATHTSSTLWVEKYRPKLFIDLLSNEGVNRTVLHWLKFWDHVVFGKEINMDQKPKPQTRNKFPSKFPNLNNKLNEGLDEHNRPLQKITLLCGPPGLGKTTLAKIVAEHAGYNVVELNASDDRNPEVFKRCLESTLQMQAVIDRDRRPNCLVIDEIDGAPAPSINLLVSFVKSNGYSKGKRKKGDIPLLMRPIICICNDQYSPALKPLRQIALLLKLPPTSKNRLVNRLHDVSLAEGLKTNMSALYHLCEKSETDIRSCLSTIQFLHNSKKELLLSDINNSGLGQKDIRKSLFAVWQDVFHFTKPESKRTRTFLDPKENLTKLESDPELKSRFIKVLKSVQTFGEYEKLFPGLFENYLKIRMNSWFESIWEGAEWLCFADIMHHQMLQNQLFLLAQYLPYTAVGIHMMFAASTVPRLSYPSPFYECISKRNQISSILTSIVSEVVASLKGFSTQSTLVLDLLPSLETILKPPLRPMNIQLYTKQEISDLKRVVDVMIALNLSYRQERSIDGQYDFVLEPNVNEIVTFSGIKSKKELPYITKHLISREIMLEKVRRSQVIVRPVQKSIRIIEDATSKVVQPPVSQKKNVQKTKGIANFLIRKPVEKVVQKPVPEVSEHLEDDFEIEKQDIWFCFNEGYTNAVRRTVFVKDLL